MRRKNSITDAYHSFSSRQQRMRHDATYSAPRSVRVRARGGPLLRTVSAAILPADNLGGVRLQQLRRDVTRRQLSVCR